MISANPSSEASLTRASLAVAWAGWLSSITLLSSVGGAGAVASPVIILVSLAAISRVHGVARIGWFFVGGVAGMEGAWLLAYLSVGEGNPVIWMAPVVGAILVLSLGWMVSRR